MTDILIVEDNKELADLLCDFIQARIHERYCSFYKGMIF